MKKFAIAALLITALAIAACGGGGSGQPSAGEKPAAQAKPGLELLEATFAHGLDENLAPVEPDDKFAPQDTIYLSIKLKGTPKEGQVTARFLYKDREIATATVDLAEERKKQGLIFVVGGNTYVGFTLTPDDTFPIGKDYRAEIFLNGAPAGSYPFAVVPPEGAIPSKLLQATLAKGVTEDYSPVEPTNSFAPTDKVFVVGRVNLGLFSTLKVNWYVSGKLDEAGTRALTAQENIQDAGFYFNFIPEGGWPAGEHRVVLLIDGQEVGNITFTVK